LVKCAAMPNKRRCKCEHFLRKQSPHLHKSG
jgi:hypothetical protein